MYTLQLLPETMFLVEEVSGECIGPSGDRFEELAPLLSAVNATSEQIAQAKGEILAKLTSLQSAKRLRDVAVQAFLCVICRDITRAPVVLHPACGRIVGCVKQLDDENAVCPLCRGVISPDSSFVQVNGLRELLETLNDSI